LAWQAPLDGGFLSFHLARSLPFSLKPTVFVTDTVRRENPVAEE
jgi:hypothetical protein